MVRVCESNIIFPCVRRPSICPSHYLLLNHLAEFKTNLLHHFTFMVRVCESNIIFPCVQPSVRPSICLSHYLFLNHWAEFNQTCKGVRKQHFFSVRPSTVHLSVTPSSPKPLGGIQPNLLHHFPSW